MARRRRAEDVAENHDRWLVSYADFITLLFAFFVVMYAISTVSEGKYRVLSDSLVLAFRNVSADSPGVNIVTAPDPIVLPRIVPTRTPAKTVEPSKPSKADELRTRTREKMRDIARELMAALNPLVKDGRVRVTETAKGVTLEINASVLFAPGDARVDDGAAQPLRAVAAILAQTDFPVIIEGHTDTTPISTAQFPSNWELSAVRASSVVRLFVEAGMAPARLTASGYGEQRPVAPNETAEGRARNRRVTLLIESPDLDVPKEVPIAPPSLHAEAALG